MNDKISLVIPVYNAESSLRRCVGSVRAQTYRHLEIIIIDDGSTDGTARVCDSLARDDSRVRVIHQHNQGVSAARNAGLEVATGQWIMFVDGDDELLPTACETLMRQVDGGCVWDMVMFGYESAQEVPVRKTDVNSRQGMRVVSRERALDMILSPSGSKGYVWNKLFSASVLGKTGRMDALRFDQEIYFCEDLLFCVQSALRARSIGCVDAPLYVYSDNPDSAVHALSERTATLQRAFQRILGLVPETNRSLAQSQYAVLTMELTYWAYEMGDATEARANGTVVCEYWDAYFQHRMLYPAKTRLRMAGFRYGGGVWCRTWGWFKTRLHSAYF